MDNIMISNFMDSFKQNFLLNYNSKYPKTPRVTFINYTIYFKRVEYRKKILLFIIKIVKKRIINDDSSK